MFVRVGLCVHFINGNAPMTWVRNGLVFGSLGAAPGFERQKGRRWG